MSTPPIILQGLTKRFGDKVLAVNGLDMVVVRA
jgi:hypothetical protein